MTNDVGSCSSSLVGFGGVFAEADEPMGQDEGEGLNGIDPPLGQFSGTDEGSADWVLDRIILFCKKMGLAIEGKEMELVSFIASLYSLNNKSHQLGEEKGNEQEEGDRAVLDGDSC